MGNVGRFFCVALPFILTAASLAALLIVGLTGVANNSLYMFRVNTTDLSINEASLQNLLKISARDLTTEFKWHDPRFLDADADGVDDEDDDEDDKGESSGSKSNNITVVDLGLSNIYEINLWGYCATSQSGERTCTKAQFDWAAKTMNTSVLTSAGSATGLNITLPKDITTSLDAFKSVTKWTQVVFIIAVIALGVELLLGLFTSCSRIVSCVTWIVSGVASAAVIAAAAMITVMSSLVVGAVEATAKWYGVKANFNTSFLAVAWIAAAFAVAASLFWLFTICCCKPDRSSSRSRSKGPEGEKFIPVKGYAPLHDDTSRFSQQSYGAPRHQQSGPRTDLAYEPYSHSNV